MKYSDLKEIFEELKKDKKYSKVIFYYQNMTDGYSEPKPIKNQIYCVLRNGSIEFHNSSGKNHNEFGPATIYISGVKEYAINGIYHRVESNEEWINSIHVKEYIIKNIIE